MKKERKSNREILEERRTKRFKELKFKAINKKTKQIQKKTLEDLRRLRTCTHPLPRVIITQRGKGGIGMFLVELCTHCGLGRIIRRVDQV